MVLDRGSINITEKAIRRVSERLKAGNPHKVSMDEKLAVMLDEIADEIVRIASGNDERGDAVGSSNG